MAKFRRVRFAGILGLCAFGVGVAWMAVWSQRVHNDPRMDWLTRELRPPTGARLLILSGGILAVSAGITYLACRLAKKAQ